MKLSNDKINEMTEQVINTKIVLHGSQSGIIVWLPSKGVFQLWNGPMIVERKSLHEIIEAYQVYQQALDAKIPPELITWKTL